MDFSTENRLPALGRLDRQTRQQVRRLALGRGVCCRCGQALLPGQVPCFDDGRDAHLECSFARNTELRKLGRDLAIQDARDKGTTSPCLPVTKLQPLKPLARRRGS